MVDSTEFERWFENLSYSLYDFETCGAEPVKFCGAIQSAGKLLVLDKTQTIYALSANIELPKALPSYIGKPLGALGAEAACWGELVSRARNGTKSCFRDAANKQIITAYHTEQDLTFLEIQDDNFPPLVTKCELGTLERTLQSTSSLRDIAETAVHLIAQLVPYERILIYRFNPSGCGETIAELTTEGVTPLLGLHYPASDIPPQARQLCMINDSRIVFDTQTEAVPLLSKNNIAYLDLSKCSLRAGSPLHQHYLVNMGVRSSLVIPLRPNGKLWGLIVVHGCSEPKIPTSEEHQNALACAKLITAQICHLQARQQRNAHQCLNEFYHQIVLGAAGYTSFQEATEDIALRLSATFSAESVFIKLGDYTSGFGSLPPQSSIDRIIKHMQQEDTQLWSSNSLPNDLACQAHQLAAGALSISLDTHAENIIIWFRPELTAEVRWAGRPPHLSPLPDRRPILPRTDFDEWKSVTNNQSLQWSRYDIECAEELCRGLFPQLLSSIQASYLG